MPRNTRDRILEAGLKLFSEKGFLGATTREISQKAGVAELTLFRHFVSKEGLFEEIINRYSFLPALKGLLPALYAMSYREALSEIARRFLSQLAERRELIRIMQKEMHLYPTHVKDIYHNFMDVLIGTLASYFREQQKKSVLRMFNAETAARAFLGMFFAYFNAQELLMLKDYRSPDLESVIGEYVDIFTIGTLGTTEDGGPKERPARDHDGDPKRGKP
jgi:AcrR family transcriptional regulator